MGAIGEFHSFDNFREMLSIISDEIYFNRKTDWKVIEC